MSSDLPTNWGRRRLDTLVNAPITYGVVQPGPMDTSPTGVRFVRAGDIARGRVLVDQLRTITPGISAQYDRTKLRGGEVVVSLVGNPGEAAVVPDDLANANVARQVGLVRVPDESDAHFVSYCLQSPRGRQALLGVTIGSVQAVINLRDLKQVQVPWPPRVERLRITALLRTVDDKIDSNRRLAVHLEETTATIFRARFVDFVGVEEFEESNIGRIPSGWRAGALTDLARFVNGKAFTKHANNRGRPILRIKELNDGVGPNTPRSDIDAAYEQVAHDGDILFAWSGSLDVYRWSGPESLINQHIFKVIPEGYPLWFVLRWIDQHMADFRGIARDKATTMGHIQRRHLSEAAVPVPDVAVIGAVRGAFDLIDAQQRASVTEVATLGKLRDALLPKLISGEIRVPDTHDPEEVIGPTADELAVAVP